MTGWDFLNGVASIIWGISWTNVLLIIAVGWLAYILWSWTKDKKKKFSLDDLFLDHKSNKADLYKLVVAVTCGLSVWTVVKLVNTDKPVETLLLGILGIFVTGRWLNAGVDAWKDKKEDKEERK